MCVYLFVNKVNNKRYIGQTVNLYDRYVTHRTANQKCLFHNAIRKHSFDNFEFTILEQCSKENLDVRETYWIQYYQSHKREFGYNIDEGPLNKKFDENIKKNGWKALKKRYPNGRYGKDNPMFGIKLTPEQIEIRRQNTANRYKGINGEAERDKSRIHMMNMIKNGVIPSFKKGDKHRPETIEKIRIAASYNSKKRPVASKSDDGTIIQYISLKEAGKSVNGSGSSIAKAIRENRKYRNREWYYLGEAKYGPSELVPSNPTP